MRSFAIVLALVLATAVARGQDVRGPSLQLAPLVSLEYGSPLFISRAPGAFNRAASVEDGISSCFSLGLGAEAGMGLVGPIGLIGQIGGIYSTGQFNSLSGGDTIAGHEWKLDADVLAGWSPSSFSLRAGPWVSTRLSGTLLQYRLDVTTSSTLSTAVHYGVVSGLAWQPAGFPLRPELTARLDLSQLSDAGVNAWSFGISFAYPVGGNVDGALASSDVNQAKAWPTPAQVRFLVNRSQVQREVPLERVEQHVKEYAMVDSANAAPRVRQWVVESYHLPPLSVLCEMEGGVSGSLTISKDSIRLMQTVMTAFNRAGIARDTTELDTDPAFLEALGHLNIGERNRLVAEFRSTDNSGVVRDTLLLPPVDTTRAITTIAKKQFRFEFSLHYASYEGGSETLNLLLDRMKALLEAGIRVTVLKPANTNGALDADLMKRIEATLGSYAKDAEYRLAKSLSGRIVVVLDL